MGERNVSRYFPSLQYVGPANGATSLVIVVGFVSTLLLTNHHERIALTLLAVAVGLDRLDGFLARRFNDVTPLGEQLDSLSDALVFCFLPAYTAYYLGFDSLVAIVILSIYVLAGLWRLAYFNLTHLQDEEGGTPYFIGVPTTICASWFVVSLILRVHLEPRVWTMLMFPFFVLCAVGMVSSLRYKKNGRWTKVLYALVPLTILLIWI